MVGQLFDVLCLPVGFMKCIKMNEMVWRTKRASQVFFFAALVAHTASYLDDATDAYTQPWNCLGIDLIRGSAVVLPSADILWIRRTCMLS